MKKLFTLFAIAFIAMSASAMSDSKMRQNARFLTDRMAHELDLSIEQYEDCYEINYDFIYLADRIMDDVMRGYEDAFEHYYRLLDNRNDDIRYILTARQYRYFTDAEYFYRPIYSTGRTWNFRIYRMYSNRNFYYYNAPKHYSTYRGTRRRSTITASSRYANSYSHSIAASTSHISGGNSYENHRRGDFGHNIIKRNETMPNQYNNRNSTNREKDNRYNGQNSKSNQNSININSGRKQTGSSSMNKPAQNTKNNGNNNSGIGNNSHVEGVGNGVGVRAHHR